MTKRTKVYGDGTMEWVDGNLGSKLTMKYPSCYLMEPGAKGEILSVAFAGDGQHQDAGGKIVHAAPHTTGTISSKSISKGAGRTSYRGLVKIYPGMKGCKTHVNCDALLLDEHSRSDTYPYMEIEEDDVAVTHEATVSKIGEEQLFYLMSRGIGEIEARADDRARLHRADRQGAADGVRHRAEPPDRARDGRLGRLDRSGVWTTRWTPRRRRRPSLGPLRGGGVDVERV